MSSPAVPPDVFAEVSQAWAIQDYAEGERILATACKRYPFHWHLRTCHAAALGYCSRFRTARRAFESLLADTTPDRKIHMCGLLGIEWCRIGRHDLAVPLLRMAAAAVAPPAPVFESLANALDHVRDASGATEVLNTGLKQYPNHPGLLLIWAGMQRRSGNSEQAEATVRKILANPITSAEAQAKAGYELGHALDQQGRYREAFAAFLEAKRARIPRLEPFRPVWEQRMRQLQEAALPSGEDVANWRSECTGQNAGRLAMLVGCPRSGTTLLERVLDAHPDLVSASETTIFSNILNTQLRGMRGVSDLLEAVNRLTSADALRLRREYQEQMEDALEQPIEGRFLLDKNPSQLARLPAVLRIFPDARILMALRDPRAIAWSCFTQYLPDNAESTGFNQLDTAAAHVDVTLRYWLRLRERLPAEIWQETRYEDMVERFDPTARRALSFLGLDWNAQVMEFHSNPSPVRSPTYAEAARPIYQHAVEKWRHYEEFLGGVTRTLSPVALELGYDSGV